MKWAPLNLTIRVGCRPVYETPVPTLVLFVLRPRLEGRVLVMQEKLSFGIGLPARRLEINGSKLPPHLQGPVVNDGPVEQAG